jgi:alpha-beta hydrolase superfamily lysophospholipase
VCSHRSYRRLAERFEEMGIAALRFDYEGTGDSAGDAGGPGLVEAWLASVRAAVALVRGAGARRVVVVGMRVGATLAAGAVAAPAAPGSGALDAVDAVDAVGAVDAMVLWDPCASGRTYLREQRALGLLSIGGEARDDGSVEVPGIVYDADTVEALSALSIAGTEGPLAERVLVLTRAERTPNKAMVDRLEMEHVEWGDAVGQAEMVDVEPWQVIEPVAAIGAVASWVSEVIGPESGPWRLGPGAGAGAGAATGAGGGAVRTVAVVERRPDGGAISERIVALGPVGLFGIVTEPGEPGAGEPGEGGSGEPGAMAGGPTAILFNAGRIDHVGPSRLWVDFAREWAGRGVRVLRFDLSGLGDSPVRPGQAEDIVYPPEALDDLTEVVKAMGPDGAGEIVLSGLCSGGYHSVEGGIALGVRAVCLINPSLIAAPAEAHGEDGGERAAEIDPRRQAATARRKWVRALPAHDFLGSIVDRLPDPAWWVINRVAVGNPPGRVLGRLVEAGVETYIVCGETEARAMRRGQAAAFRRLARTGRFHLEVVPGIDHELFARVSRDRVRPMVTERIQQSVAMKRGPARVTRNT